MNDPKPAQNSDPVRPGGGTGWYSRGYLPHFDSPDTIQHVTIHLADSLPKEVLDRLEAEIRLLPPNRRDVERRKKIEDWRREQSRARSVH